MNNKFYITTPIYYPSGKFHIGTAYTEVIADAVKRYHVLLGEDCFMLTGTDEHGQKIQNKAKEANMSPKDYVDMQAKIAIDLWEYMDIDYDKYIRTTDEYHVKAVEKIFEKLLAKGDIYKGEYEGLYCEPDETYYTEKEVENNTCPMCGRPLKHMKEEAYFFNMQKYVDRLLKYYDEHPDFIKPAYRKQEMINNFIKPGLNDLCITRTSFDWGIKVPSDPKHVVYVWLDALTNYITALGYASDNTELFDKYWPADLHILGKDISRFHLIYWPIFLMALDLELPKTLFVHNWITMKNGKMSKSFGNVIYPQDLINRYGLDATKYFLLRSVPTSADGIFTPEDFVERYNSDLCNDLSNLLNRTVSMVNKYCDGKITAYTGQLNDVDEELENFVTETKNTFDELMKDYEIAKALQTIFALVSRTNKYIDDTQPWKLAKSEDSEDKKKLESVMYHLVQNLKSIAILIRPFMTNTSDEILRQLGISNKDLKWEQITDYTSLKDITVIEKGEPIFMRLNVDEEIDFIKSLMPTNK